MIIDEFLLWADCLSRVLGFTHYLYYYVCCFSNIIKLTRTKIVDLGKLHHSNGLKKYDFLLFYP
jgi:hypothetical protein